MKPVMIEWEESRVSVVLDASAATMEEWNVKQLRKCGLD